METWNSPTLRETRNSRANPSLVQRERRKLRTDQTGINKGLTVRSRGRGLRTIVQIVEWNRRASNSLSPVLIHFVAPHGKLHQRLLALEHMLSSILPLLTSQQYSRPREPQHSIPPEEWPNLGRRVIENHASLRRVAAD